MTLASVIIPSRGGAQRLPRLLSALAAQDDPEWEAIVVLDGDIDHSEQVLEQYSHLPVQAIVFPENRGRVAALNAGFGAAAGEVLIRCDDDLVPNPDYIRAFKMAVGRCGAVIGLCRNQFPDSAYARVYGRQADERFRAEAYSAVPEQTWRYWGGNCGLSREAWERVGPYDQDYRAYGWEDVDYGFRVAQRGYDISLAPSLETDHFVAAVTTRIRVQRAYHSGAAQRIFDQKHPAAGLRPQSKGSRSAWNTLVSALGRLSRPQLSGIASVVDVLASVLPSAVARKLVAALVEAASLAGYRRPNDTTTDL